MGARRLGYEIVASKESMFELRDVPAEVSRMFSERAAQVEARLAERGQNRATASAAEKQIAALDTRATKQQLERGALLEGWRSEADAVGLNRPVREVLVRAAEDEARRAGRNLLLAGEASALAQSAVRFAAEKLGERQAVFSPVDLERDPNGQGAVADLVARRRAGSPSTPRLCANRLRGAGADGGQGACSRGEPPRQSDRSKRILRSDLPSAGERSGFHGRSGSVGRRNKKPVWTEIDGA